MDGFSRILCSMLKSMSAQQMTIKTRDVSRYLISSLVIHPSRIMLSASFCSSGIVFVTSLSVECEIFASPGRFCDALLHVVTIFIFFLFCGLQMAFLQLAKFCSKRLACFNRDKF